MRVEPSLERVDVLVEVTEPTTVIPRNALIEANQSGLIAEPLIDITPQTPIPDWKVGILDIFCCDNRLTSYRCLFRLQGRHIDIQQGRRPDSRHAQLLRSWRCQG